MVFAGFDNTYPEMYGISIDILISSPVALLNYRQKDQYFHLKDSGLIVTFHKPSFRRTPKTDRVRDAALYFDE